MHMYGAQMRSALSLEQYTVKRLKNDYFFEEIKQKVVAENIPKSLEKYMQWLCCKGLGEIEDITLVQNLRK